MSQFGSSWRRIRELIPQTRAAVHENLATPCIRNMRCLLLSAVATTLSGEEADARRLEEEGEQLGMQGFDDVLRAPRLRLSLIRGDLGRAEALLVPKTGSRKGNWFYVQTFATHLDGLVALGKRQRVEEEAPPYLVRGTYLEPFALRALGQVRDDDELIRQALARFEEMGLEWHADQTRSVLARA
jgi:hypothetical protein